MIDVGYRECVAKEKYDKRYAMDTEELLAFLRDTQPEEMATLEKIHKDNTDEMVVAKNQSTNSPKQSPWCS